MSLLRCSNYQKWNKTILNILPNSTHFTLNTASLLITTRKKIYNGTLPSHTISALIIPCIAGYDTEEIHAQYPGSFEWPIESFCCVPVLEPYV